MSRLGPRADRFLDGFLYPGMGLGLMLLLTILEPDFGTTFLMAAVGAAIMLAGGTRLRHLAIGGVCAVTAFAAAVAMDPVRLRRIKAFFDPESSPEAAYHAAQSQIAFILGGLFGKGLGESMQKQFYLPEAQTDFIFAIIGEELGFIATALIVALFLGILVCGLLISIRAPDRFGSLIAFGATLMIVLQAAINIGVVTGCLPTKGLPLPFISYGGSSLVVSVGAVCLLLNVACHSETLEEDEHVRPVRDRMHWF
jgi:cell division protein FtsW